MYIDVVYFLLGCCGLVILLSGLMVLVWLRDRGARWLLWMSLLFIFGGFSLGVLLTPDVGGVASIVVGTTTFLVAFHLVWSGMRVFEGRRIIWIPVLVAVPGWLGLAAWGSEASLVAEAAVVQSVAGSLAVGLCAVELWRSRSDGLWSRWALIGLFAVVAIFFGARLPFISTLPYPFGTLPQQIDWTAAFVLSLFCAAIVLAVLCLMLAKEKAEHDLRSFALTDALTQLLNRRAFNVDVARVALRHRSSGDTYCLLMLDLDNFKSINDRHGHSRGDEMLVQFARIAAGCLRPQATLYRLGGEEFCCLLPQTSEFEAVLAAERIRTAFAASAIETRAERISTTVSVGVVSSLLAGGDPADMQGLADTALYRAKRLGRNRVAVAVEPQSEVENDLGWAAA